MPIKTAADIDLIKQGVYQIPVKTETQGMNSKFFQNVLFGGPTISSNGDYLVMDYRTMGAPLATEALKGADPTRVNYNTGFNEKAIFGQYYNPEDQVSVDQAVNRVWGEPIDQPWDMNTRLSYLLAEKRDMMIASISSAVEKLCVDSVLNGYFETKYNGMQTFPLTMTLLGQAGANMSTDPVGVISKGVQAILKKKGTLPKMLIMNPEDAVTVFSKAEVLNLFDNRRVLGNEKFYQALDENGAAYCGTLNLPGIGTISVVAYYGTYDKSPTTKEYFLPKGKAILCPEVIGSKGYCGVYVSNGLYTGKTAVDYAVNIWAKQESVPYSTHIQVQSAPCPIVTAIDRYCVFTNIS